MLVSCNNGKKVTIFEIGDSEDVVINTLVKDFTIGGEHWTRDQIKDELYYDSESTREYINFSEYITLYDCVYKGQEYYKVRVYFSGFRVRRIEVKIEKNKMKSLHRRLKSKYGKSYRANLPRSFGWEISTVYIGDIDGIIVTDKGDLYLVEVVSGEELYKLKSFI